MASAICKPLQYLTSALTQGGEGGHLGSVVQLCCGEEGTLQINITGVCGECLQCLDHTGFAPDHGMLCLLSRSTLLRLQAALQGNYPKPALGCVHFPGLSCSGWSLRYSTKAQTRLGLRFVPFPGTSTQVTRCLVSALFPGGQCILSPPQTQSLSFLGAQQECRLRCYMCLLCGADLWLRPSWWMSTI